MCGRNELVSKQQPSEWVEAEAAVLPVAVAAESGRGCHIVTQAVQGWLVQVSMAQPVLSNFLYLCLTFAVWTHLAVLDL